jgi:putative endonuclease
MKPVYVYILKCSDSSYYTGITNDLERRINEHREGRNKDCYTYSRRPVELVYHLLCFTAREAIILEKKIKGWSKAKKVAFIEQNWIRLHELSKCKNNSSSDNFVNNKA